MCLDFRWCHLFVHLLSSSRYTITLRDYQSMADANRVSAGRLGGLSSGF